MRENKSLIPFLTIRNPPPQFPQFVGHLIFSVQVYEHDFGLQLGKRYKHNVTLTQLIKKKKEFHEKLIGLGVERPW